MLPHMVHPHFLNHCRCFHTNRPTMPTLFSMKSLIRLSYTNWYASESGQGLHHMVSLKVNEASMEENMWQKSSHKGESLPVTQCTSDSRTREASQFPWKVSWLKTLQEPVQIQFDLSCGKFNEQHWLR